MSRPLRILFLSAWFPFPPDNGSRIRVFNLMRALARHHEVFLVSLLQEDSNIANAERFNDFCTIVATHPARRFRTGTVKSLLGFLSKRPRSFVDTYDPMFRRIVEQAINVVNPDALVASTLGVVEYVLPSLGVPSVLEEHNCEYAVLKRNSERIPAWFGRKRYELGWKKFARWEAAVCRRFGAVTMVSESDKRLILEAAPDLKHVYVVPNGVDTDHYSVDNRSPEPARLIYNGALTYGANLDAVRYFGAEIYPTLAKEHPEVTLVVTGRYTGVDLTGIQDCPGIKLVGYVDDIRDQLRRSAACVVPLREGGGSRLKILEAMASGVPVVASSIGAEGIEAEDGRHLLIADSPAEFAEAVHRVLSDADLAFTLAREARMLVEKRYAWRAIGEEFARIVEDVASRKTTR